MTDLRITIDSLGAERAAVQDLLRRCEVPRLLGAIDPGCYGFTRLHLDLLESLEIGLAVLGEMPKTLRNLLMSLGDERATAWFVDAYSLFVAASVLVDGLPPVGARVRVAGSFASADVQSMLDRGGGDPLSAVIVRDYLKYLEFYWRHPNPDKQIQKDTGLVTCTSGYFQLLVAALRPMLSGQPRYLEATERIRPEVLGRHFQGVQWTSVVEQEIPDLMDVTTDDIVGNQELISAGLRLARDVAGFDFESHQNPKRLNPVLFAMGDPGCGKTVTCHAIGQYFLKFCRERDIPSRFLVIRRTDWASSYQNASAGQLIDIFKTKVAGFAGVVGVYWPDIDTAFAARDDPGVRGEEKNILGACFGIFDGTIIPKNGQWFMLCDANTLNMDKATVSRITQDPFHIKGPVTAEDFVTLMRDKKLKAYGEFVLLDDDQWRQAGQKCVDFKLSGRSVENITRRIVVDVEDFEYPDEYFKASLERRRAILREQSHPVSFEKLMGTIDHYYEFEKEAEERAHRLRFQDRVREIVFNMSAQAAAAGSLMGDS